MAATLRGLQCVPNVIEITVRTVNAYNANGRPGAKLRKMSKNSETYSEWMPRWTDDQLIAAIPLQQINNQGLSDIERLNELMDSAYVDGHQPFLYPVWSIEDTHKFDGLIIAVPEWLEEFGGEGHQGQRQFYEMQGDDGWTINWHHKGVFEFPYERINDCLYLLYQRELDDGIGRTFKVHFHIVRKAEHDARNPVGILLTTADGDTFDYDVTHAMYHNLMESS